MGSLFPHLHLPSLPLHAIYQTLSLKNLQMIRGLSEQTVFIGFLYPTTGTAVCLVCVRPGETASELWGCSLALWQHQSKAAMHRRQWPGSSTYCALILQYTSALSLFFVSYFFLLSIPHVQPRTSQLFRAFVLCNISIRLRRKEEEKNPASTLFFMSPFLKDLIFKWVEPSPPPRMWGWHPGVQSSCHQELLNWELWVARLGLY